MDSQKLRQFRKAARTALKQKDPEAKKHFASKLSELAKTFSPDVKEKYSKKYGFSL